MCLLSLAIASPLEQYCMDDVGQKRIMLQNISHRAGLWSRYQAVRVHPRAISQRVRAPGSRSGHRRTPTMVGNRDPARRAAAGVRLA